MKKNILAWCKYIKIQTFIVPKSFYLLKIYFIAFPLLPEGDVFQWGMKDMMRFY